MRFAEDQFAEVLFSKDPCSSKIENGLLVLSRRSRCGRKIYWT